MTTAEGLYPFTGVKDLTLDISLARGVISLDNAINLAISPGTNQSIAVFGIWQSAIIASLEMPKLLAEGFQPSQISFTLVVMRAIPTAAAYPASPARVPQPGRQIGTATRSNYFPTTIWTLEYHGFA